MTRRWDRYTMGHKGITEQEKNRRHMIMTVDKERGEDKDLNILGVIN